MLFSLTLSNAISYKKTEKKESAIYCMERGSELCICLHCFYSDVIFKKEEVWRGERSAYTEEEKRLVESGVRPPEREGYDLSIPEGFYTVYQGLPCEGKELDRLIFSLAGVMSDTLIYARLYRENDFETVFQLFLPKEKAGEQN